MFFIPLTMPPRKQPLQQDPEEEDDTLVTGKQFKQMIHMMESLTASMNETFNKTTLSMNEMFHKSRASTETTLEWMQHGIAAMADRVQALETRLPVAWRTDGWTSSSTRSGMEDWRLD
jgi:hypothetical protein